MKKKVAHIFRLIIIFLILLLPVLSHALSITDPLVPCTDGKVCDFGQLMVMIDRVIKFTLYFMAIPIAAISFTYAGFEMVTAPGGEAKTKARKIFTDTVIGLIIAVAAFLIVKLILSILGYDGSLFIGWFSVNAIV